MINTLKYAFWALLITCGLTVIFWLFIGFIEMDFTIYDIRDWSDSARTAFLLVFLVGFAIMGIHCNPVDLEDDV